MNLHTLLLLACHTRFCSTAGEAKQHGHQQNSFWSDKKLAFCSWLQSAPAEPRGQKGSTEWDRPVFIQSFTPCNLKFLFLQNPWACQPIINKFNMTRRSQKLVDSQQLSKAASGITARLSVHLSACSLSVTGRSVSPMGRLQSAFSNYAPLLSSVHAASHLAPPSRNPSHNFSLPFCRSHLETQEGTLDTIRTLEKLKQEQQARPANPLSFHRTHKHLLITF